MQFPSKGEPFMALIIQLKSRVLVINPNTGQMKPYDTNSMVPILPQHPDDTEEVEKAQAQTTNDPNAANKVK